MSNNPSTNPTKMKRPYICPQIEKLGLENEDQLLAGSPDLGINIGEETDQWTNKAGTNWVNEEDWDD